MKLYSLHRIAVRLYPFRAVFLGIAILALVAMILCLLLRSTYSDTLLEPSIVTALWGLLLFAYIQMFQQIPPPVLPHDHLWRRCWGRIKLGFFSLMAIFVICVSLVLLWMSFRLLTIN